MSKFLTGDELNDVIDDIIQDAKKFVYITSPYIKLDYHFKERFDIIKNDPSIYLQILFGKNENDIYRSVNSDDLDYFKSFPNISIIYEPRLHAKSYFNESRGVITSMNLYDFSAENNVEYGVHFTKNTVGRGLFEDHYDHHIKLLDLSAHCIYIKRPVYKKVMLGLSKNYIRSEVLLDIFETFDPASYDYSRINYHDIDIVSLTNKEALPDLKTRSQKRIEETELNSLDSDSQFDPNQDTGYCIRTGQQISFNPKQPLSKEAYYEWLEWRNMDYKENYCHQSGRRTDGKTSMRFPILNSKYKNDDTWN